MSSSGSGLRSTIPPTYQADATLAQANPVSGTIYTVLDTTANVEILSMVVYVTWTVQPSPLQLYVDVDGNAWTFTVANPVSTTAYFPLHNTSQVIANGDLNNAADVHVYQTYKMLSGKSVRVRCETTGGTVQNLNCRVRYAKW